MSKLSDSDSDDEHALTISSGTATMPAKRKPQKHPREDVDDSGENSNDNEEPVAKFIKKAPTKSSGFSDKIGSMMAKMGYKAGEGLGKHNQGRREIVEASKQRGRRGLGLIVRGLEADEDITWAFEQEEVLIDEKVDWMPKHEGSAPSLQELLTWKRVGPKKKEIVDETHFVDPRILEQILKSKAIFDSLEGEEMRRARTRSNPYETIRGVFFLNRAAMKMSNMDAILDFMFTNPVGPDGKPLVSQSELFYFADICAGPGGFSEYVLWRRKGDAKGFGLTRKSENDFKLEDFYAGPSEMFEPHYGVNAREGDGDIFSTANQDAFAKFVKENTDGEGVHVVMADGGFSVEGQENLQEVLSKQLYLCQFLTALKVLRKNGNFVCKLFDLFTPFSVGLVYLMRLAFHQVAIIKPVTSRPANSERYLVCKNLNEANCDAVRDYFDQLNGDLGTYLSSVSLEDILEVVPLDMLKDDQAFFDYMLDSNDNIGEAQIINLGKIKIFAKNAALHEARQAEVRTQCLDKWQIPDKVRAAPPKKDAASRFEELMGKEDASYVFHKAKVLESGKLKEDIKSVYDYRCMVTGGSERVYLLGLGKSNVYKLCANGRWQKLVDMRLELPTDTLLEAEIVVELKGEGKGQRKLTTVHAMDALFLYGKDVRDLHFTERSEELHRFAKALHRPTRSDLVPLKVPDTYKLEDIHKVFERLDTRMVKGSGGFERLCYSNLDNNFFLPTGVYLIRTTKDPWMMGMSKTQKKKYYYNTLTKESSFTTQQACIASARDAKMHSLLWVWEEGVSVISSQPHKQGKLSRNEFVDFVHQLCH